MKIWITWRHTVTLFCSYETIFWKHENVDLFANGKSTRHRPKIVNLLLGPLAGLLCGIFVLIRQNVILALTGMLTAISVSSESERRSFCLWHCYRHCVTHLRVCLQEDEKLAQGSQRKLPPSKWRDSHDNSFLLFDGSAVTIFEFSLLAAASNVTLSLQQ